MRALLLLAWRNARSSLSRTAMTVVAVCLGVAFLSGALSVADTMAQNISNLMSSQYDSVDVVVRGEKLVLGQRADLDEKLVGTVEEVPEVASAAGVVEGFAQPIDLEGKPVGSVQQPGLGRTWIGDDALQSLPLSAGRGPEESGEVALDATTAEHGGLAVGDALQVATPSDVMRATMVGVVDVSSGTGSALTWFDADTAQEQLGIEGKYQEILVAGDEGVGQEALASEVARALDSDVEVLTGAEAAQESQAKVEAVFGFFKVLMLTFVGIGLVVCTFIVYNTFAVLTAQRTKQLATLRALGARARQVTVATLFEGLVLGLLGAVLGILVGYLMTRLLTWLIGALGIAELSGGVVLSPSTIALSILAGLTVTVVGAYPAARAAGRMPPIGAMRSGAVTTPEVSIGQILLGLGVLTVAIALIGRGATMGYPDGMTDLAVGVGVLLVGLVLWARPLIVSMVEVLAPMAGRLGGLTGDLAGRNAVREPKRTTVTAGSLAIGLALVSTLGVLAASTKATLDDAASESLTADVLVLPLVGQTPMSATVTDAVRQADGVAAASPILMDLAAIDGEPALVSGVDPVAAPEVLELEMTHGDVDALRDGELLVAASIAQWRGLREGQEIRARFADSGPVDLRIGGVFDDNVYAGSFLLDESDFRALTGKDGVWYVYAASQDGTEPAEVRDAVADSIDGIANTQALTLEEFTEYQDQAVDQALAGIYFMLLFAVVVAVVGVANTVALSVNERFREIGMLRAVGMRSERVARMIRWEAVMTSLAGAALGIAVGLLLGLSLRLALEPIGFSTTVIPWREIGVCLVLAGLAGVLAAWLPARRASRLPILDALRSS